MRRFLFVCVTLAVVLSTLYALKPTHPNRAVDPRIGHPVASIGDVFRHY